MLPYRNDFKQTARHLRKNMTDAERILWYRLRNKQIGGVRFYRQKPIGNYIVDFYAPKAKMVIEEVKRYRCLFLKEGESINPPYPPFSKGEKYADQLQVFKKLERYSFF